MAIDVSQAIQTRHCKRAFLDQSVDRSNLEEVLKWAANAGSSKNSQPWQVAVVMGEACVRLSAALCAVFDQKITEEMDYQYMMAPIPDEFMVRARTCGYNLFDLKGISRDDHGARTAHNRENYEFFGAPVQLVFHLPAGSERGNFLDMGLFMQNVMLGLLDFGLASCPQVSIAQYPDTVRQVLGIPLDRWIVAGMSVGYSDPNATVNTYVPERLDLESYTQWLDH